MPGVDTHTVPEASLSATPQVCIRPQALTKNNKTGEILIHGFRPLRGGVFTLVHLNKVIKGYKRKGEL